jgi:hypothetical protein
MRVTSLGYRTDLALRALEGGTGTDRGDYLVARNPALPDFWWANFLLLARPPAAGTAGHWLATFAAGFPEAQHVAIALDTASSQDADPAPFVATGLEYERNLVLTAAPGEVHEPTQGASAAPPDADRVRPGRRARLRTSLAGRHGAPPSCQPPVRSRRAPGPDGRRWFAGRARRASSGSPGWCPAGRSCPGCWR